MDSFPHSVLLLISMTSACESEAGCLVSRMTFPAVDDSLQDRWELILHNPLDWVTTRCFPTHREPGSCPVAHL